MKKTSKKPLELSRETVRSLDKGGLEQVAGGNTTLCQGNSTSGIKTCGCYTTNLY